MKLDELIVTGYRRPSVPVGRVSEEPTPLDCPPSLWAEGAGRWADLAAQ